MQQSTGKFRLRSRFLYDIPAVENAVCHFWKFDFSNFKMTFAKFLMKTTLFFNDKFSKFLKCFFDKVLPCGNFRHCNDGPLNIFPILHKKAFSFFNYSETSK